MQRARLTVDRRDRRRLRNRFARLGVDDFFRNRFNGRGYARLVVRKGRGTKDVEGVLRVDRAVIAARLVAGNRNDDVRVFRTRFERVRLNRAVSAARLVAGNRDVAADGNFRGRKSADVFSGGVVRDRRRARYRNVFRRVERAVAFGRNVVLQRQIAAYFNGVLRVNRAVITRRRIAGRNERAADRKRVVDKERALIAALRFVVICGQIAADRNRAVRANRADRSRRRVAGNRRRARYVESGVDEHRAVTAVRGRVVFQLQIAFDVDRAARVDRADVSVRRVARRNESLGRKRAADVDRAVASRRAVVVRRQNAVDRQIAVNVRRAVVAETFARRSRRRRRFRTVRRNDFDRRLNELVAVRRVADEARVSLDFDRALGVEPACDSAGVVIELRRRAKGRAAVLDVDRAADARVRRRYDLLDNRFAVLARRSRRRLFNGGRNVAVSRLVRREDRRSRNFYGVDRVDRAAKAARLIAGNVGFAVADRERASRVDRAAVLSRFVVRRREGSRNLDRAAGS